MRFCNERDLDGSFIATLIIGKNKRDLIYYRGETPGASSRGAQPVLNSLVIIKQIENDIK